jgi:hypothetical protein
VRALRIGIWVIAVAIGLLVVLFVADVVWNNFITDNAYREGMYDSGQEKVVIYSMRDYFHGKKSYPVLTFEDLHQKGIITGDAYDWVKDGWYAYYPFGPETPDRALVLSIGPPLIGEYLHKGDFTAGRNDPDIVIRN